MIAGVVVVLRISEDPPTGVIELVESLMRVENVPAVTFTPDPVVRVRRLTPVYVNRNHSSTSILCDVQLTIRVCPV